MKKRIRLAISLLLVLCMILTYSTPFAVFAQDDTEKANALLDEVLAHPFNYYILFYNLPKIFFNNLEKRCPALTELKIKDVFLTSLTFVLVS